jgi:alkylation response protein AidB-like acyl-CoA dehydrogenase
MSISFAWDKEQLAFKEATIAFAQRELNDNLREQDRTSHFDRAAWQMCADFGILGWPIPKAYGGAELDCPTIMLALEGLGYGCRNNGLVFVINNHVWSCEIPILHFGTAAQKERYLPDLCRGTLIGGHALTEPGSGSAAFAMQTAAVRCKDRYILNGTKTFISNAPIADVFVTFARTDPTAGAERGVSALIIRHDFPGVTIAKEWEKAGLRTAPMGELVFQDCEVPADHLLGREGAGYRVFQSTIEWERGFFFASQIGVMERILEQCVRHARERKQFDRPIGSFQAVSHKIADMKLRLELAKLILYKIAWLKQEGRIAFLEASLAKLFISEGLVQTCLDAMQIHGARGYMTEYELEREQRDAIAGTIYAGTSEIQRGIVASLLGVGASLA